MAVALNIMEFTNVLSALYRACMDQDVLLASNRNVRLMLDLCPPPLQHASLP
jgi:hypothetical protein